MHNLVVTYKIRNELRDLITSLLGPSAGVSFIAEMPPQERMQALAQANAVLTWNLPRELGGDEFTMLENVRLVQLLTAGADHLPYAELPSHLVIASNVGAYAAPIAEHVMAMTLALTKNLVREHNNLTRGEFNQSRQNRMLQGRVCGIIGFGGIGKAVAVLMRSFGVKLLAMNTSGKTGEEVNFIGTLDDLGFILSSSDIVVLSLPLINKTRNLIGKRELSWMRDDAILINVARGGIIDEASLYVHLNQHPDFKAGIDTWWTEPFSHGMFRTVYPFFNLPNVLGSPHNSAIVVGMSEESTKQAVENIVRFWNNEQIRGKVRREDYQ